MEKLEKFLWVWFAILLITLLTNWLLAGVFWLWDAIPQAKIFFKIAITALMTSIPIGIFTVALSDWNRINRKV